MKNIYKYFAAFVAFSAAVLSSGITVSAQNLSDNTYLVDNGIAYAKRAILNNDGTYSIDLETFVIGEVTQSYESIPADVVLVLDVSGSMDETITTYTYSPASVSSLSYRDNNGQTNYYYFYNDEYCRVSVGRTWDSTGWFSGTFHYHLSFQSGGRTYYINTSGQVVTERPTNVDNERTNLLNSSVRLYTRSAGTSVSKLDALKSAVRAFMSTMNKNDLVDPETGEDRTERLGNRIAIVAFSGAGTLGQSNHDNSIKLNTGWKTLGESVADSTGLQSLKTSLQDLDADGGTHVEYGMQDALALIQSPNSTADVRTVVVFTDGVPGAGSWDGAGHQGNAQQYINETVNSANDAISYSKQINAITIGSGEDATNPVIYAVGLFDSKPAEGSDTYTYMNYLSSNYPNASSMTSSGGTKESNDFYLDASGGSAEDLEDIFVAIAHSAGGSENTEVSGGSTLTVDIVSSSFSVPQGFEEHPENAITVLVAPCNGITTIGGNDYLEFGEAKDPSFYGLDPIEPSISEDDNKVSTTGFDYSANWCGPDPTSTSAYHNYAYHGYKQIIRFTITVNEDAVGGPAVETNDSGSGIYLEGSTTPLITFNRPTVKLPVQIWIQKNGLQGEDSAVFTLARSPFVENFNPKTADWESITKIVVGPEDYDPETGVYLKKQVGLNPDYYYRIKEDAWAFGYQYQYGGVLYTVGEEVHNPFVFDNTPKNKKFDEAQARNIFNEKTQ